MRGERFPVDERTKTLVRASPPHLQPSLQIIKKKNLVIDEFSISSTIIYQTLIQLDTGNCRTEGSFDCGNKNVHKLRNDREKV